MRCCIAFLNFIGVFGVTQLFERKVAAIQKMLRLANGLRNMTKQARHLSRWLQIPLGIGLKPPTRIFQRQMFANTSHDILQFAALEEHDRERH